MRTTRDTPTGPEGDVGSPQAPTQDVTGPSDTPQWANATFQASTVATTSQANLAQTNIGANLQPSQGAGSGQINPSSETSQAGPVVNNNDAQWLRVFSLVVYGQKGGTPQAASATPNDTSAPPGSPVVIDFNQAFARARMRQRGRLSPRDPGDGDFGGDGTTPPVSVSATGSMAAGTGASATIQNGIELSALRCVFNINKTTATTPNILYARIYNMSPATMGKVIQFTRVQIKAGYKYTTTGLIFDGTIVQFRRGKENPVDTYLEIHAGDGDFPLTGAMIDTTFPVGSTDRDKLNKINNAMQGLDPAFKVGQQDVPLNQAIQREHVMMGQTSLYMRQIGQKWNADHWMDNGTYQVVSKAGYIAGQAVVLTPRTGLIGLPEVTPQGIQVRCLLNPRLRLGGLIKLDSNLLSGVAYVPGSSATTDANGNVIGPGNAGGGIVQSIAVYGQSFETAWTSPTGTYKIILMNYNGDTRGNQWYCDLICVALDANNRIMIDANPSTAFTRASAEARNSGIGSVT